MRNKIFFIGAIIIVLIFLGLTRNQISFSAPLVASSSVLDKDYSSDEIDNISSIAKPIIIGQEPNPEISANSYLVIDHNTRSPIVTKNAGEKLYIGSLTKLMTAVVALESGNLNDVVRVEINPISIPEYRMELFRGEEISLESLLYGILIKSANDAAEITALHVGGGDYNTFISMMNEKAQEIGMWNTHFSNAMGIDNEENYSTAQDLAFLASYALKNSFIAEAVQIKEKRVYSADSVVTHYLLSTNKLLFDEELSVFGLKTGTTPMAGECLITLAQNKNGNEIITVLLGSNARFAEAKELIEWTFKNVEWH